MEKLIDRKIHRLSREEVEDGQVLLTAAASRTVAFLIPGDPMSATTHIDLRLRAARAKIRTRIVHGVSIVTSAAGSLGLQVYKFGRTTTVPFSSPGFAPTSPLEVILDNRRMGLHTLVLLDLREDGSFLAPRDAIASLLRMASAIGTSEFGPQTLACVLSRVGSPQVRAFPGRPRPGASVTLPRDSWDPSLSREGGARHVRGRASRPLSLCDLWKALRAPERDLERVRPLEFLPLPFGPEGLHRAAVNLLRDIPL